MSIATANTITLDNKYPAIGGQILDNKSPNQFDIPLRQNLKMSL